MRTNRVFFCIKRFFDIVVAFLGIVISSPAWIAAIIGIKLSDPGPIFYMANRVGINNTRFRMYKFRSMRVDTSANEKSLRADADRIFPFGRFIRSTKIDELPQFINVILGDMSMVGPRPASVDQVEITRAGLNEIAASVLPGLTGPSAIYDYIYGDQFDDEKEYIEEVLPARLALDRWYVEKMGIGTDLRMIIYTVVCVFAYLFGVKPVRILNKLLEGASEATVAPDLVVR